MKKSNRPEGAAAFDAYYAALFGSRWPTLREALIQETQPIPFTSGLTAPYYLDRASIYAAEALPVTDEGCCLDMCAAPGGKNTGSCLADGFKRTNNR